MQPPPPPPLPTLSRKPSWQNRAGRVDRAACAEIRASELRRFAEFPTATTRRTPPAGKPDDPPASATTPARRVPKARRIAAATVTITARFLAARHKTRRPLALIGSKRTARSNAMKPASRPDNARVRDLPPINPNVGGAASKQLGLWESWQQTIRIERWQRPSRSHKHTPRDRTTAPARCDASESDESEPNGSDARRPPSYQHFLICPQCSRKAVKLFLVLCTPPEARDADLAEQWLATWDHHLKPHHDHYPARAAIINRYGPLFRDRRLTCRHCLDIRYGESRSPAPPPADRHPQTSSRPSTAHPPTWDPTD